MTQSKGEKQKRKERQGVRAGRRKVQRMPGTQREMVRKTAADADGNCICFR